MYDLHNFWCCSNKDSIYEFSIGASLLTHRSRQLHPQSLPQSCQIDILHAASYACPYLPSVCQTNRILCTVIILCSSIQQFRGGVSSFCFISGKLASLFFCPPYHRPLRHVLPFCDMAWLQSRRQGRKFLQPVSFHRKASMHAQIYTGRRTGSRAL